MMVSERTILHYAKVECMRLGLRFFRNAPRQGVEAGWPDVIVLGPSEGRVLWMETKAPGKPLRAIQNYRRHEIQSRGGHWCKPDSKSQVTEELILFKGACK